MLKKILPTTNFEKTNLVVFSDSKTRELKFENLNLYTKELSELRKTYRDKIIEENTKIVTNMVSHYYYHDEKYLFDNIGKSPRIIDAAIKISGYLYKDQKYFINTTHCHMPFVDAFTPKIQEIFTNEYRKCNF